MVNEDIKAGDVVKFLPGRCEANEINERFIVVEWNTDRGFIRPAVSDGSLVSESVELVNASDIIKA